MKSSRHRFWSGVVALVLFVAALLPSFGDPAKRPGADGPAPTNNATLQLDHMVTLPRVAMLLGLIVLVYTGLNFLATNVSLGIAVLAYFALTVACMPKHSHRLYTHTTIANLWTPAVWLTGLAERLTTRLSLINSGILVTHPDIKKAADGGGVQAEIPFIKEPNISDGIQVESGTLTISNLTSGQQTAAVLNRRWGVGATALSKGVSGIDPLAAALDMITDIRLRQRQTTLLNILRGVFGFAAAPGAGSAAFKANRRDIFLEAGAAPAAGQLFSSDDYIKTLGLLGEVKDTLDGCVIVCHSAIEQAMAIQDDVTVVRDSEGKARVITYKGAKVFVSDLLVRAGGTSGFVYDTYIFMAGAVAYGEKDQTSEVGDVAAFYKVQDQTTNNAGFADYTRFILHPQGAKWGGTPAGQSATNAELATEGNWTLAYGDAKNAKIVCLRTNG